ncbi:Zinc finger, SWIM-type [Sesbania bispinosa]|nr:Zinc finger, SWIM-type [Sesbania bispinosa]
MQRKDRCREPRAITRTRCQARLRVRLGYLSGKWTVTHFEPNHNHELTPSTYVHLISSYRGLSEGDKAQVNSLHMYGVRTCHILGFILGQKGGYADLGFCKKDLYNHIDKDKRAKIKDGDAFVALCCLQAKADNDPMNACENVKSPKFLEEFKTLLYINIGPDEAVKEYRHNELMSDFKTKFSDPVLSISLYKYEIAASKVYTRNKFWDVRKEIENVAALNVIDRSEVDNKVRVKINKFGSACSEYVVIYDKDKGVFACDCHLFESCGIPCSHIFCTMKNESIEVIPESLICKRWTKAAKDEFISELSVADNDSSKLDLLRTSAVADACNRLFRATCKYMGNYRLNIDSINKLTSEIEKRGSSDKNRNKGSNVIGDPIVVKTKGAPRKGKNRMKSRHCSHCKRTGHYVSKCPALRDRDKLGEVQVDNMAQASED